MTKTIYLLKGPKINKPKIQNFKNSTLTLQKYPNRKIKVQTNKNQMTKNIKHSEGPKCNSQQCHLVLTFYILVP